MENVVAPRKEPPDKIKKIVFTSIINIFQTELL